MRTFLVALAAVAFLSLALPQAAAQQSSAVTIALNSPDPLTKEGQPVSFTGTVTLTADITAYTSVMGIPVSYTVTKQPAWASVLISPASDVFPLPSAPTPGLSYTVTRTITVVVGLVSTPDATTVDVIEIAATTTPSVFGKSATGKGSVPISFIAPEEEDCPDHLDDPRLAALAVEAADAYNEWQAAKDEEKGASSDDVTVQSTGASPVPLPWVAVGGFALVGAGVGLALRRRSR